MENYDRYNAVAAGEELEKFRSEIKYPNIQAPAEISRVIEETSNLAVLRKLDPASIYEYSTIISAYALYLSQEANRIEAKMKWLEANIKHIVGKNLTEVPSNITFFTEKDLYIRSNEKMAAELELKKLAQQTKYESIKFISQKMQFLSETLQGLARERSYARRMND